MSLPDLKLTVENVQAAADAWDFNCGPGALCAVLGLTPDEARPHIEASGFAAKGFMTPTMIVQALKAAGAVFEQRSVVRSFGKLPSLENGLVRIQWGGPWMAPGVHYAAAYKATHWVAVRRREGSELPDVFDVNGTCAGWMPHIQWADKLVPWLLAQLQPRWDGTFWPTHGIEVLR